jgi:[acyl-carrier-protein] S-malonyltransferase
MGRELYDSNPAAADIFDRAEQATSIPIKRLCFEGPEEELTLTCNAQPCIFTLSAALLAVIDGRAGEPDVCAGLSLGEYTALYAAGSVDFETCAKLVAKRGELMQQAATARDSGMAAVMGLDEEGINRLCDEAREDQILTAANFNCPGQIVISGDTAACERAAKLAEEKYEARATILKVAGAFHSDIMIPAVEQFREALESVCFGAPSCPVYCNVDAAPCSSPADIPGKLLDQLTHAVRWQQSMEKIIAEGLETPYEIGPGKSLMGMMRRIDRDIRVTVVNSAAAVKKVFGGE